MDDLFNSTTFDIMLQNRSIQMLKTVIPYINGPQQKNLSILIKYMELQKTIQYFDQEQNTLQMCSAENSSSGMMDMIAQLRDFCTDKEKETLDMFLNFFQMFSMYETLFD